MFLWSLIYGLLLAVYRLMTYTEIVHHKCLLLLRKSIRSKKVQETILIIDQNHERGREETQEVKSQINKPLHCGSECRFCANKRGPRPAGFVVDERSNCSSQRRGQKDRFPTRDVPVVLSPSSQYLTISHFVSSSFCHPIFLLPRRLRSKMMMNIWDPASKYIHSDFLLDAVWVIYF